MTQRARRRARVLMVQGTSSYAGKSTLVAALCRLFARDGYRVAPFKALNISLNAAVVAGGEIGVAQALQARSACAEATVEMNPVLVKPAARGRTQVVLLGRPAPSAVPARAVLWRTITRSLDALRERNDLVVIEGAGAPSEINLRRSDLTNMRVARYARAPVLLVGDIDRGGVFASLVGTMALFDRHERALVAGLVINKLRGDAAPLRRGIAELEARTSKPVLGVLPYAPAWQLPEEDSVAVDPAGGAIASDDERGGARDHDAARLEIAIVHLPYLSNFDEFDSLEGEPGVRLRYVRPGQRLGRPDLVILPGSKSTVADLEVLRRSGLAVAVKDAAAAGTPVLGICGGYQMLGRRIDDPARVESDRPSAEGLALLPVVTVFGRMKRTARVRVRLGAPRGQGLARAWPAVEAAGYEIHVGRPTRLAHAWLRIVERDGRRCDEAGGAASVDGLVCGTAVHGLLADPAVRGALLDALWRRREAGSHPRAGRPDSARPSVLTLDERLDGLADLVARHLDMARIYAITGLRAR